MVLRACLASNWRWVVVSMSWILYVVMYGIMYSYGLLFIEFQDEFDSSATLTGWAGAIAISLTILLAPPMQIIIDRFGYRPVAVVSLVLSSAGVVATSFVPNMLLVYVTYSLMYGCGAGSLTLVSLGLIVQNFPSKNSVRALALALSGSSLGMLAFPPLMTFLFDLFGWRNSLRIVGSLFFIVGIPCVASFVPSTTDKVPSPTDHQKDGKNRQSKTEVIKTEVIKTSTDECVSSAKFTTEHSIDVKLLKMRSLSEENYHAQEILLDGDINGEIIADGSQIEKNEDETSTCSKSVMPSDDSENSTLWQRLCQAMTYPELWMISFAVVIMGTFDCFYYVNMVSYMISVGYTETDGARFLSVMGASTIGGKLGLSFIGEFLPFPSYYLMIITCLVSCVVMGSFLVVRSLTTMLFLAAVIGGVMIPISGIVPLTIPNSLFGPERFRQTWPVLLFCNGFGFMCGSVLGQSIDRTGSYRIAILISISMYFFVTFLFIGAPMYQRNFAPDRYVLQELHRLKRYNNSKANKEEESCIDVFEASGTKLEVTSERVTSV